MAFDIKKHVIRVQGNREYLPVSARLVWFRQEHPDWSIVTAPVEINLEKQYAIFSATIMNAEGKIMATGTKMENIKGFGDFIEKAECVPTSTQMLTLEGWKTHEQLRIGETVAAYNIDTDALQWVPLLAVRTYENSSVVRLSNGKGFDVVCTPDHKWAVQYQTTIKDKKYSYRRLRESSDLKKCDAITTAAVAPAPDATLPVTAEQAFVMGMLITDGSLRYNGKQVRGYICQSKPDVVAIIREQLAHVPHREEVVAAHTRTFPTGKTYDCRQGYRWCPSAAYLHDLHDAFGIVHDTELPNVVGRLSVEARAAMLEAMTLAEADKKGSFAQMPGRNDWVIDTWTYLCALEGSQICRSTIRETCGGIWVARRKKTRRVWANNVTIEDAGRMNVWCPQTPLGTWVARFDNDVVTVTGNTGAVGRALAMCGFGTQFAPEMEEGGRFADAPQGPMSAGNRFQPRPNGAPNGNFGNRPGASRPNAPMNGNGNGDGNRPPMPMPVPAAEDENPFDSAAMAPPARQQANRPPAPERTEARPSAPSPQRDPMTPQREASPQREAVAPQREPTPRSERPAPPAAKAGSGIVRERVKEPEYTDPGGDDEEGPEGFEDDDPFAEEFAAPAATPRAERPAEIPDRLPPTQLGGNRPNPLASNPGCSSPGCTMKLTPAQVTMSMQKAGKPLCVIHLKEVMSGQSANPL